MERAPGCHGVHVWVWMCSISAPLEDITQPVIFTPSGRYIGDAPAFADLCLTAYGVTIDIDNTALERQAQVNMEESDREMRQVKVLQSIKGKKALLMIDIQVCQGGGRVCACVCEQWIALMWG